MLDKKGRRWGHLNRSSSYTTYSVYCNSPQRVVLSRVPHFLLWSIVRAVSFGYLQTFQTSGICTSDLNRWPSLYAASWRESVDKPKDNSNWLWQVKGISLFLNPVCHGGYVTGKIFPNSTTELSSSTTNFFHFGFHSYWVLFLFCFVFPKTIWLIRLFVISTCRKQWYRSCNNHARPTHTFQCLRLGFLTRWRGWYLQLVLLKLQWMVLNEPRYTLETPRNSFCSFVNGHGAYDP